VLPPLPVGVPAPSLAVEPPLAEPELVTPLAAAVAAAALLGSGEQLPKKQIPVLQGRPSGLGGLVH
jgi:hypothetical protein